ncbi:MAG: hypothetical protein U0V02_05410 [Anaerolineales bacterium]
MHFVYLLIEFLDELIYGISEAAWPLIRNDLHLNYVQIGLALSLPGFLANFIEPFLFAIADTWKRRAVILAGGIFFTISLALTGISYSFLFLLASYILFHPSSGAFVSVSQASLMDLALSAANTTWHAGPSQARLAFSSALSFSAAQPTSALVGAACSLRWHCFSTLILAYAWKRIPNEKAESDETIPTFKDILNPIQIHLRRSQKTGALSAG